MVKIAICDDSLWAREDTKKKLLACSFDQNIEMQIDGYETGELFLEDERKGNEHDLVMMDYDFILKKPNAAILLIRRARDEGIHADYVLMDTWFTTEPMLEQIRSNQKTYEE